jgi:hypothetical protein
MPQGRAAVDLGLVNVVVDYFLNPKVQFAVTKSHPIPPTKLDYTEAVLLELL